MPDRLDEVQKLLKQLPGLGYRSAERIALHLLVERPERLAPLMDALSAAAQSIRRCGVCGNVSESDTCEVCANPRRDRDHICVVEQIQDLMAIERSGAFEGVYHVLHGKLSPIHGVGPDQLNLAALGQRLEADSLKEVTLALSNDIEGEATCHFIQEEYLAGKTCRVSRIGFGVPSGSGVTYADATTLKSALEGRREYR